MKKMKEWTIEDYIKFVPPIIGGLIIIFVAVIFRDIGTLVFTDDVDDKLFSEKVLRIIRVGTVSIPKTMSSLLVASRCERVGKIEVRS